MSADNGYILRKNERGKYVLQRYSASAEDYPPIEPAALQFDTVEEAILKFEDLESRDEGFYASEYGLTVKISEITPDPEK